MGETKIEKGGGEKGLAVERNKEEIVANNQECKILKGNFHIHKPKC